MVLILLLMMVIGGFYFALNYYFYQATKNNPLQIGVTFSPKYAVELGLDPLIIYHKTIDELGVKAIRLPIYWDEIEPQQGKVSFSEIDKYVQLAEQRNVKLILAIGQKAPRWPECYTPEWALDLPEANQRQALLNHLEQVIVRYQDSPALEMWQLENEPFHHFGTCLPLTPDQYQVELDLLKKLDPNHPVMTVDSGEWGNWQQAAKFVDTLGITLYRRTYLPYAPYAKFYQPPLFYRIKAGLIQRQYPNKPIMVAELQAEPWTKNATVDTPIAEQLRAFPLSDLKDNLEFVRQIGFSRADFWGVEWWYYLETKDHPEYLAEFKKLLSSN